MKLWTKMLAAATIVMVIAIGAHASVPTRSEIVKRYADKSPKQWGEMLPGIARTLDTRDDVLALTLDLCRGDASALDRELVAFLIENDIPATFFVSSRWIKQHSEDLAMLASVPIFEIGAHGVRHVPASLTGRAIYGITGTKDAGELYDEVMQNADELTLRTGARPKFFRSGTAFYDEQAIAMIRELGMIPAGYSVLGDAGATYSAEQVVAAVTSARSGDIIIAHANHPESGTGRGLMRALPILRAKGFSFVKLSDRLKLEQNDISHAVTADEMARRFGMRPYEENGSFVERHPAASGDGRPASGCIYYYLGKDEMTQFHVVDCGEYWVWSAGEPLEMWQVGPSGVLIRRILGIGPGMEPTLYFEPGTVFGARHIGTPSDGTFVTCITVRRFSCKAWRLVSKEEMAIICPPAMSFYEQ